MASKEEVYEARNAAQIAVLKRVETAASGGTSGRIVSELALAYRYLEGGAQPGNTTVEK